jgi:phosphoenolpyruvate---glycerone phosphotransferase subunit DhaL
MGCAGAYTRFEMGGMSNAAGSAAIIRAADLTAFLAAVAERLKQERGYLTELDSPIGDADHGINLDRGFSAVAAKLADLQEEDLGAILKMVGTTLVSTVGGASGPLYGTAFLRAGGALGGRTEAGLDELVQAARAALDGIVQRGKAQRGEKTMVDAIAPAVESLEAARDHAVGPLEAARQAVAAAEQGMLATTPMFATKGRASYLGERSIGHQDPGATSAYLIASVALATAEQRRPATTATTHHGEVSHG